MGGNDALYGGGGNDVLDGGDGDDVLNGGAGADLMAGGAGNDIYSIDDVNDQVYDTSGVDTVVVSVDYNLDKLVGIENISGSGASKITLRGTTGDNTMTGSNDGPDILHGGAGNDVLSGFGGNDVLYGEAGRDILAGGTGRDIFVFNTPISKSKAVNKANLDKIADFSVKDDSIYMENKVFKALGKKGSLTHPKALTKDFFYVGTKAHDANDHIIYNKKTGALYYDADGTGHQAQVQIATLSKNLKMSYHDFFVI
jgi:Ca2+-binding RTX toxin-like protein